MYMTLPIWEIELKIYVLIPYTFCTLLYTKLGGNSQ